MKTIIDGETFCRTCLCTTVEFHSLLAENLIEILKQCTSVDVDEHETTAMICRECHSLLLQFWQFRLNSLEADAVVKSAFRVKSEKTDIEVKSEDEQQSYNEYESKITGKIETIDDRTDADTKSDYPRPVASIAYRPLHGLIRLYTDIPKLEEPSNDEDIKPEIQLKRRQKPRRPNKNSPASSATNSRRYKVITSDASDDLSCKICNKIFKNADRLHRHIMYAHTVNIPRNCDKCSMTLKNDASLKRHIDACHNGINPIPRQMCAICGLVLTNIRKHVRRKHGNTTQRSFSCRFCQALFVDLSSLGQHLKAEHERERDAEAKNYECKLCAKKFRGRSSLHTHVKLLHSDKYPFPCSMCKKQFKLKHDLTRHMRLHTDERPYECDLCDKKFRDLQTMKTHRRVHTGEKPYVCNVCQRAFSERHRMKSHMKLHNKC